MGIDAMLRVSYPEKAENALAEAATAAAEGRSDSERVEVSSVCYLTVPDDPPSRRPSTADKVIQKLQVERVEGGGLSIQGVALASHCHVTLGVFGLFFVLAGVILSYISYSVNLQSAAKEREAEEGGRRTERNASVTEMRKIGPAFLVLGLFMLALGISMFVLARKISRDEKARQKMISEQQLCQLEDSFSHAKASAGSPLHTAAPAPHQQYPILAVRRNSWWMDPAVMEAGAAPGGGMETRPASARDPATSLHSEAASGTRSPVMELLPGLSDPPAADIACFPPPPLHFLSADVEEEQEEEQPQPQEEHQPRGEAGEGEWQQAVASVPVLSSVGTEVHSVGHVPQPRLAREGSSSIFPPIGPGALPEPRPAPHVPYLRQEVRAVLPVAHSAGQSRHTPVLVPYPGGAAPTHLPAIQVTAASPVLATLPRLSRHCSDSRPTTADTR